MSEAETKGSKPKKSLVLFTTSTGNEFTARDAMSLTWEQLSSIFLMRLDASEEASEEAVQKIRLFASHSIDTLERISMERPELIEKVAAENRRWPILQWVGPNRFRSTIDDLGISLGGNLPLKTEGVQYNELYVAIERAIEVLTGFKEFAERDLEDLLAEGYFDRATLQQLKELPSFSKANINQVSKLLAHFTSTHPQWKETIMEASRANIDSCHRERLKNQMETLNKKYPEPATLGAIEATHHQVRLEKIQHEKPSDGDVKKGVYKTIKNRLKTILR